MPTTPGAPHQAHRPVRVRFIGDKANPQAVSLQRALGAAATAEGLPPTAIDFDLLIAPKPEMALSIATERMLDDGNPGWTQFEALVLDLFYASGSLDRMAGLTVVYDGLWANLKKARGAAGDDGEVIGATMPWKFVYISTIWLTTKHSTDEATVYDAATRRGIDRGRVFGAGPDAGPYAALAKKIIKDFTTGGPPQG